MLELPARHASRLQWKLLSKDDGLVDADFPSSYLPRYRRGFGSNKDKVLHYSPIARFTEIAPPIPRPPMAEFNNAAAIETINANPHLFKIVTPIKVDVLQAYLKDHPNQPFVASVCKGLIHGFWPWANTHHDDDYPLTYDNSWVQPNDEKEAEFLIAQRDIEIAMDRFSPPFGPDLLPGMYSTPIHAVPKPRSEKLRLVVNQSAGTFSQNSMILWEDIAGCPLDTIQHLIPALLEFRRGHGSGPLVMFKSDVAEAFRLLPMHPLWQIKQVITTNVPIKGTIASTPLVRNVDRNNNFGGRASARLWESFIGLVVWIAIFKKGISDLFCYMDDNYGWDEKGDLSYYEPYDAFFPDKQVRLLSLWDELGIPHKQPKQLFGMTLPIIGYDVDPNNMSVTMPPESKADLCVAVQEFIDTHSRRRTLKEFLHLQGWMNWSFNSFPMMHPALCNMYAKTAGKNLSNAKIFINENIRHDLTWFLRHVQNLPGILMFQDLDWHPARECDLLIFCDASMTKGLGFWVPEMNLGFHSPIPDWVPDNLIFYREALCVLAAIAWCAKCDFNIGRPWRLAVLSDNTNMVDMFGSMRAAAAYNEILKTAVDLFISNNIDCRVIHIEGERNDVADALSRTEFARARALVPNIIIKEFTPPRPQTLGAAKC